MNIGDKLFTLTSATTWGDGWYKEPMVFTSFKKANDEMKKQYKKLFKVMNKSEELMEIIGDADNYVSLDDCSWYIKETVLK